MAKSAVFLEINEQGAYGSQLGRAFRQDDAPSLITRALHKSTMAVTELRCDQRNFGVTSSIPKEEAYLVGLQLRACPDHDLYFEGRLKRPVNWVEGITSIYDLRRDPVADIRDPFHSLMFDRPQTALEAVSEEESVAC